MRANFIGRICSLFFAAVFLTAAQGQALGLRHCSLHDSVPGTSHPGTPAHGSVPSTGHPASAPDVPGEHDHGHAAQEGQHSGALGGCMDDCHVGSTSVVLGDVGSISSAALYSSPGALAGSRSFEGPRHLPYELHLPNAPPLFA